MSRLDYNLKILYKLQLIAIKNPDLRFGQILWAARILERTASGENPNLILDPFYIESKEMWEKLNEIEI